MNEVTISASGRFFGGVEGADRYRLEYEQGVEYFPTLAAVESFIDRNWLDRIRIETPAQYTARLLAHKEHVKCEERLRVTRTRMKSLERRIREVKMAIEGVES